MSCEAGAASAWVVVVVATTTAIMTRAVSWIRPGLGTAVGDVISAFRPMALSSSSGRLYYHSQPRVPSFRG